MKLKTTRFGEIEVNEGNLIYFPDGLIGFEECKQYFALYKEETNSVWWLQSVERPEIAFILTDPLNFMPDYEPTLTQEDMETLRAKAPMDLEICVILVVPQESREITANLLGPIVINTSKRIGIQAVLRDSRYSHRYAVSQPVCTSDMKGGGEHADS